MENWKTVVLSQQWMGRIDRLAERRFGAGGLAEEAASFVIERLAEDDWRRCREFRGKASSDTFLHTLVNNSIEEFARQRFGRVRPPEWLKREGPLWVELWQKLCMERQPAPSVMDRALCGGRERALVEQILRTIRARLPWCGQSRQEIPLSCFEDERGESPALEAELACEDDAATGSRGEQYESVLIALGLLFGTAEPSDSIDAVAAQAAIVAEQYCERFEAFRRECVLSDEERLCLRLVFQDGLKKNEVGRLLGVPAHQPGRMLQRVFERVRDALERCEIDLESLEDALAERV